MNYSMIKQIIKKTNIGKAVFGSDTSKFCSIRAGGKVPALVTVQAPEEMISLLTVLDREKIKYNILGGGTNILFTRDLPDLVLVKSGKALGHVNIYPEGRIEVGGAASTEVLVRKAAEEGMDLTFLAGIPGTVGGAIAGNSGSSDKWICDNIVNLKYIRKDKNGFGLAECGGDQIDSGYRFFDVPGLVVIISAVMTSEMSDPDSLAQDIRKNTDRRKETQPVMAKTCGCFFKNPGSIDRSAGTLVDGCGLKSLSYGGARVSPVHANFIENFNNASPYDIVVLSRIMMGKVKEKYGIDLEYEVELIGLDHE